MFESSLAFDSESETMKLQVEGVDYEDLTLAPEEVLMHRAPVINNFVGRIFSTVYAFLIGVHFLKVVGQYDKRTTTTTKIGWYCKLETGASCTELKVNSKIENFQIMLETPMKSKQWN